MAPVGLSSMKDLKNKIREAEKEGKIFAGLDVFFKDHSETWMNVNLTEIEKPEIVKKAEKNLKKATREYKKNNSVEEDYSTAQHTSLTKWTEGE